MINVEELIKFINNKYPNIININIPIAKNVYNNVECKCKIHNIEIIKTITKFKTLKENVCYLCNRDSKNNEIRTLLKNKFPKLNFDKFEYKDLKSESIVICTEHGEFRSSYKKLKDQGNKYACPSCSKSAQMSQRYNTRNSEMAISEMKERYPNLDFSKFEYHSAKTKSIIICPEHGEFETTYEYMIRSGRLHGCPKCVPDKLSPRKFSQEEAIENMKKVYSNFDFSKFEYKNTKTKSIVICKTHGEFEITYADFTRAHTNPCPYCAKKQVYKPIEFLEKRFPELNFSKFNFIDVRNKSIVICPEHGEFEITYMALKKSMNGCSKCSMVGYSKSEKEIVEFIKTFYDKKIIENNRNIILNEYSNNYLELDIYLPDIKLAIEFNGRYWHNDESISKRVGFNTAEEYHSYKSSKCKEQNIFLLHIDEHEWLDNKNNVLNNIKDKIISIS